MKWLELSVETSPEFVEPLSQIFYRYGHGGIAIEEDGGFNPDEGEKQPPPERVTIKTYIPVNSTLNERRSRIDLGVRLVAHVGPVSELRERELDEEDWQNSWKQHFHALHIGRNIVINPSWLEYTPKESDIVVTLDPGMAFGTGHHPTTRMCLERIEAFVKPGMDMLDVGCGSGILSITAARLGARSVYGLEIDSVAVRVAKQNVDDNDVGPTVRITEGTLPHGDVRPNSYDIAVANISSKVVTEITEHLVKAVRPGGTLIVSGILLDNKSSVEEALAQWNASIEHMDVDTDWVTLVASVF